MSTPNEDVGIELVAYFLARAFREKLILSVFEIINKDIKITFDHSLASFATDDRVERLTDLIDKLQLLLVGDIRIF